MQLIFGILFSTMLLIASPFAKILHRNYIWNHTHPAVYKITPIDRNNSGGTGFLVTYKGSSFVITNKHVCESIGREGLVAVHYSYGTVFTTYSVSKSWDLCKIHTTQSGGLSLAKSVIMLEPSYIIGHPLLLPLHLSEGIYQGYLNERDSKSLGGFFGDKFSAVSMSGNSGSPVVDIFGNVISVVYAGGSMGTLGVPLFALKDFLEE
jgi:S1-C subfamily serine protease